MTIFELALNRTAPIHFWFSKASIETCDANELLAKARAMSVQMQLQKVTRGDCVALMLQTSIDLLAGILAAWGCRAAVCIVPHTLGDRSGELDELKISHILELLQPKLLVHHLDEAHPFPQSAAQQIHYRQWLDAPASSVFPATPLPEDLAIIQLTSGSTAYPKGVMLHHSHILANMQSVANRIGITVSDHGVSWLPFYHDMGLGAYLFALTKDFPITLIPTATFIRDSCTWMEAIGHQKATLSLAPTFAYALLAQQKRFLAKRDIDLSTWRFSLVGAEPIFAKHLQAFQETMQFFGLQDHVLQPAYGLAESVVAVAFNPAGKAYRCLSISADKLHQQGRIEPVDSNIAGALTLIANGIPVAGVSISIRRANGEVAANDEQGHVWIAGDFVTKSYVGGVDKQRFTDGWFDTGDLGFIYEGELYISGRAKDLIIRGGVNVSPAYVEMVVENCLDLKPGKVVAFSCQNLQLGVEEVVIIVGLQIPPEQRLILLRQIANRIASEIKLQVNQVVFVPAVNIPKTTSGKIQRAETKQLFLNNFYEGLG